MSSQKLEGFGEFKVEGLDAKSPKNFRFQDFILKHKYETAFLLIGIILTGFGVLFAKGGMNGQSQRVEVLENATVSENGQEIVVEIAGAVESPGVYKLPSDSRIEDALIAAGGISVNADREWMEKALNRAAKIIDGQKLYIPRVGEQLDTLSANTTGGNQTVSSNFGGQGSGLVNINTASQKELESLNGIGPVYAQNIIEHRPYSTTQELVSKGAIKQFVFEKIKDDIAIY
mgnify:FL=1